MDTALVLPEAGANASRKRKDVTLISPFPRVVSGSRAAVLVKGGHPDVTGELA